MSNAYLLLGRTGDICAVLPFLKAEADAGEKPTLVVSNQHSSVLEGCSYVSVVEFNGGIHLLKEAYEFAKGKFPNVRSLQVIGHRETVAEVTYKPAGQECARTTSFIKEQWKVAGKMPLWDSVLPLVFDRRSPEREAKLIADCGLARRGRKKKLLLVSVSGHSSPFPYAELMLELIRLRFGTEFKVLELPQAGRFYDLLAIYEQAHCLVSVDSAPLHLARACPDLPVLALTNDRPLLWNGSSWEPNWHWCCRYHDFPERAIQMLEAIETCRDKSELPFIHVWNEYDAKRKPHRFTRDLLPILPGACGRDSASVLKDEKRVPYLRDCLRMGLQRAKDDEHVLISRPETNVSPLVTACQTHDAFFAHRLQVRDGTTQFFPIGDLFSARKSWWKAHLADIPDVLFGADAYWPGPLENLFLKEKAADLTGICNRMASNPTGSATLETPRIAHNLKLRHEYNQTHPMPARYSRARDQIPLIPIETHKLFHFGYNPTLARSDGQMLMCYRYHEGDLTTKLAVARVHESGKVLSNQKLDVPGNSVEDPKFFSINGTLHLSWIETKWPQEVKSVVKYSPFGRPEVGVQPAIGKNDWTNTEKNWCFFHRHDRLFCIYQLHPVQKIFVVANGKGVEMMETPGPRWPYGVLKGPTPPLEFNGKLLSFCHGTLDNELLPPQRRYFVAAILMNPDPPFETVAVSTKPLIYGSEEDNLTEEEHVACIHYKRKVVFPGGAVESDPYWVLAFGVNDSGCALAKIRESQLNF